MRSTLFTRLVLFLVAICGWAVIFFGGWIAWRGLFLYARDPVLMGTGGGLAIGGLLVVALTLAARMQVTTAENTTAILERLDRLAAAPPRGRASAAAPRPTLPGARRDP
ncbi:hypothetical protein [Jannaschia rubra]|uniref:Uncharacterized protein n=1 Tax=Jannaschia rubra TaxID=282197 RepID=A0A0M6XUB4_9RHOB|nr:hypothetical protein [Jannaschia rubra]CTQ34322.1 hypothetical protein JAN5088_03116 [Jannaschia rubra]SFG17916.1 hypothetical protein SAMN04488517_10321 [Jannaschia rubra]